jgi:hypothetical protein
MNTIMTDKNALVSMHLQACKYMAAVVPMHVQAYKYMAAVTFYWCTSLDMHACVYVYMWVYLYIYIHIHIHNIHIYYA